MQQEENLNEPSQKFLLYPPQTLYLLCVYIYKFSVRLRVWVKNRYLDSLEMLCTDCDHFKPFHILFMDSIVFLHTIHKMSSMFHITV